MFIAATIGAGAMAGVYANDFDLDPQSLNISMPIALGQTIFPLGLGFLAAVLVRTFVPDDPPRVPKGAEPNRARFRRDHLVGDRRRGHRSAQPRGDPMNLRRSRVARTTASVAALAILIGPSAAGAWAQESPAPEPTPDGDTPTPEEAEEQAHDDGKHRPSVPKDNTFALGQSMQIRVNADGTQNAKAVNFRWSVSHLTIQGPPDGSKDGEYVVPGAEGGTLPRYLENFGFIHVENGYGQWDMNVENGWDTQRSVSIYPQDWTPNISLKTEFTLDGEPVKAQDIVGKDGLVTATYTLINNTTKPYDVVVKDINGADVTTTAEGDSPMVAITKTLLPQRYIGLNTGSGIFGADGRGNNQVQWISLPFKPLAENSQASFGWAAYVTDAVIPSLLTQVSPLYIPAHPPEAGTSRGGGG